MRLTIRTDLAMRTLLYCAINEGRITRKHDIATACNASENHLGQVIHQLSQAGYLRTLRGRAGGVALGRPAEEIRVGEVLRAFEGPMPFTQCYGSDGGPCPLAEGCRLRPALEAALDAFYGALMPITLRDLVADNHCLEEVLAAGPVTGCRRSPAAHLAAAE